MTTRRGFLVGLLATGLTPVPTWADAGNPAFLSAARLPTGEYVLVGLRQDLGEAFRVPLPTRGHAAAAHPTRPEAVAFARRPGVYALVIDCRTGDITARLDAPEGRHFYGHGVFSQDGSLMFTTENAYEEALGIIGVWDTRAGYKRLGEFASAGVGPHELALLPDGQTLVIANGGIETHPESGRAKLNIPMMRPNLSYLALDGTVLEIAEPDPALRRNSIRHLTVGADGTVFYALHWQGDKDQIVPLAGAHRKGGGPLESFDAPKDLWREMQGYAGSISASASGQKIAVTSPRGNLTAVFDSKTLLPDALIPMADVCGVAAAPDGFLTTTGGGTVTLLPQPTGHASHKYDLAFDNHLLRL